MDETRGEAEQWRSQEFVLGAHIQVVLCWNPEILYRSLSRLQQCAFHLREAPFLCPPPHPTKGSWERSKLPGGSEPRPKTVLVHFQLERKHLMFGVWGPRPLWPSLATPLRQSWVS